MTKTRKEINKNLNRQRKSATWKIVFFFFKFSEISKSLNEITKNQNRLQMLKSGMKEGYHYPIHRKEL